MALVLTVGMAACSSSKSSTSATTSAGSATTAGSTATTGGSGTPAGLAAAQAAVAKYSVQPTSITDTAKAAGPVPKGLLIDFIPCGTNPECQQEGEIVKQADDVLGWKTNILSNDGSPTQSKAAFDQAVRDKAAGVLYTAIPLSTFQSDVPALQANGTVVSACCVTDPTGTGVDYNIDNPDQVGPVAGTQAAFVASDSKCVGADSLLVTIPDFAILNNAVTNYKSSMSQYCPTATVDTLDIALANLSTGTTTIVSYLRSHPNDKYIAVTTDGLTVGLPQALKSAGLTTKIVGQGATPTNIQYLHSGQEAADVAFPYYEAMWAMVTAVVQKKSGGTITPSTAPPIWLLTPSNAPNSSAAAFPVVANYQSQYEALWGMNG